jgi:hypothetical protein
MSAVTLFGVCSAALIGLGLYGLIIPQPLRKIQKEIRASRPNVGALKLSNLLQLDRFEEDLNISKVKLRYPPPSSSSHCTPSDPPAPTPAQRQELRQQG